MALPPTYYDFVRKLRPTLVEMGAWSRKMKAAMCSWHSMTFWCGSMHLYLRRRDAGVKSQERARGSLA